jgi:drug/metabolite transporter (DMT)-like permease
MLWMAGALISFSLVAISGREANSAGASVMELMFYRSVIALGVVGLILPFTKPGIWQIATARFGLHALRNGLHFMAQFSWFMALSLIPLTQLFSLEFTAPLWVAVLAPLFLAERLSWSRVLAALIGFAGVMIVVQPGTVPISAGTVYALVAAIGFAASMVVTRALMRTDTVLCFLFHMAWMQAIVAGIFLGWQPYAVPTMEATIWITIVGLSALAAHFCLARAFVHADAIIVAPMDFLRLPLIAVVGLLVYQEPLEPMVLTGGGVVVLANLFNLWMEHRVQRATRQAVRN